MSCTAVRNWLITATCVTVVFGVSLGARAEDPEQIVVTATRQSQALFDYPGSASVIGGDDLAALNLTHHSEAINAVPGAFLQRGSGQEGLTALRSPVLTGAGACGAFLVLEDGVPIRPVGFCNVNDFFEINVEQAARIEVLRGPGIGPLGSNAVHGVFNILTPRPAELAPFSAAIEYGADAYRRVKLSGQTEVGGTALSFAGLVTRDGGWRDHSGYDEGKLNLRAERRMGNGLGSLSFSGTNLDQDTAGFIAGRNSYRDLDIARSNANPEAFRRAWSTRLVARWQPDDPEGIDARVYLRSSRMTFLQHFLLGKPLEKNGQDSAGVMLSREGRIAAGRWWVGFDGEVSDMTLLEVQDSPTTDGSPAANAIRPAGLHYDYQVSGTSLAPWASLEYPLAQRLTATLSLRAEWVRYAYDNRMIAGNTAENGTPCGNGGCLYSRPADRDDDFFDLAPRLGLSWKLGDGLTAWASLSRGFRPPETTELYRLQRQQNIADLKSETVDAAEIGLRGRSARLDWSAAVFHMDKQHFILRDANGFNVSNGSTRHEGVEYEAQWRPADWARLGVSGTWAKHTYRFNRAAEQGELIQKGNDVDTAPRNLHTVRAAWLPRPATDVELEWLHVGPYFADAANNNRYPGHDLLNLRLGTKLTSSWSAGLEVTNLTDRRYADRADFAFGNWRYFPGRNRAWLMELRYTLHD